MALDGVSDADGSLDARYWCDHALNAVRFAEGMRALVATGVSDFVEMDRATPCLRLGSTSRRRQRMARLAQQARLVDRDPERASASFTGAVTMLIGPDSIDHVLAAARPCRPIHSRAPPLLDLEGHEQRARQDVLPTDSPVCACAWHRRMPSSRAATACSVSRSSMIIAINRACRRRQRRPGLRLCAMRRASISVPICRDRQAAVPRSNGLAGQRPPHGAVDPHAAGRCDCRIFRFSIG